MQVLYQLDLRPDVEDAELRRYLGDQLRDAASQEFAWDLVAGVRLHQKVLEEEIEASARNWRLSRMAAVDRSILRLACFEILFRDDLPPAVSINEAVLLAQKFSTKGSGAFVNGILDSIHRRRSGGAVLSEQTLSLGEEEEGEACQPT